MKKKIKIPTDVAHGRDGYWSEVADYLREEGHISKDEIVREMVVTTSATDSMVVTVTEKETLN